MNNRDLRKAARQYSMMYMIFETLDTDGVIKSPVKDTKLTEVFRINIAEYLMYLSVSDGKIDDQEVEVFRKITGFRDSIEGIYDYIKYNSKYLTDYSNTVPSSMKVAVKAEKNLEKATGVRRNPTLPAMLLNLYEVIGAGIITADGDINYNERHAYNTYLDTLEDYMAKRGF